MDSVDLLGWATEEQLLTCSIKMGVILKIKENIKELNGSVAAAKVWEVYITYVLQSQFLIKTDGYLVYFEMGYGVPGI